MRAGAWCYENIVQGVQALSLALFTRSLKWTHEEVETFLIDVRKDLKKESIHAYWRMWVDQPRGRRRAAVCCSARLTGSQRHRPRTEARVGSRGRARGSGVFLDRSLLFKEENNNITDLMTCMLSTSAIRSRPCIV